MLRTGPWNSLPLTIRWLKQEYRQDFPPDLMPPTHMPVAFGLVKSKKVTAADDGKEEENEKEMDITAISQVSRPRCAACGQKLHSDDNVLKCVIPSCTAVSHTKCLAEHFLEGQHVIPVGGACPMCRKQVLWGDLIRLKAGCYQNMEDAENLSDAEQHWA